MSDDIEEKLEALFERHHADLLETIEHVVRTVVEEQERADQQILEMLRRVLDLLAPAAPQGAEEERPEDYPALFMCPAQRVLYAMPAPGADLVEILTTGLYDLFRLIIDCLQTDVQRLHWAWGCAIWHPWGVQPGGESASFSTQCSRLRESIAKHWGLGEILGRGGGQGHAGIPINATLAGFCTGQAPQVVGGEIAYPVWRLRVCDYVAKQASHDGDFMEALDKLEGVLEVDPDNYLASTMAVRIARMPNQPLEITHHSAVRMACRAMARGLVRYDAAVPAMRERRPAPGPARDAFDAAADAISDRLENLRAAVEWCTEMHGIEPEDDLDPVAPWRTREQLAAWLDDPSGDPPISRLQGSIAGQFDRQWRTDAKTHFRDYVVNLVADEDAVLPRSKKTFYYRVREYVRVHVLGIPGDTYAKKLRALKEIGSLQGALRNMPGVDWQDVKEGELTDAAKRDLAEACGWSPEKLDDVLNLIKLCYAQHPDMELLPAEEPEEEEADGDENEEEDPEVG